MDLTPEYIEFKKIVEFQRKIATRKQALADNQHNILKDILKDCLHEEVERKSSYYSGSYNDQAYTEYWNECVLCGARSEKTTKDHNWYG